MALIVSTVIVLAVIGLLIGLLLVFASEKFHVEVDPKEIAVREALPGNNCGACGFAGCDAMAAAIAKGEAPVNGCPVGGAAAAEKISAVMGVQAEATERKVAFVRCAGTCGVAAEKGTYVGIASCAAAAALPGKGAKSCQFGCLGFGSCAEVCQFGAISVVDGVARVDSSKCRGCGLCANACPQHLIDLVPAKATYIVTCSSRDKGAAVKAQCSAGCIGCSLCVKQCEHEAITVTGNLAAIDQSKCVGCGKCAEKCPAGIIRKQ